MSGLRRDAQGALCLGGAPITELLRSSGVATPAYLYDLDALIDSAKSLEAAFGGARHLTAYAVKANSAGTIVRALARAGLGADVVSGAELELVLAAGIPAGRIVMSGVAKADWELDLAIERGILAIQVESVEEIERVAARARATGRRTRVALRIKPGVTADTHAHIATGHDLAKFGVARSDVPAAWQRVDTHAEWIECVGVSGHVGSMLADPTPYLATARVIGEVARGRLESGKKLDYVDFGGGFGIDYGSRPTSEPASFVRAALELRGELGLDSLELVIEPGRSLVGPFGVLVASVVQGKHGAERSWAMIDAGMNDLIRPALYGAKHRIEPLERPPSEPEWRVVGPVCESSDDFGAHPLGRELPHAVAIRDAGAYGYVLASEYNGRPLPAEVFVSRGKVIHVSRSPGRAEWVRRRLEA
jgi:diaminopimelate decarboxylase